MSFQESYNLVKNEDDTFPIIPNKPSESSDHSMCLHSTRSAQDSPSGCLQSIRSQAVVASTYCSGIIEYNQMKFLIMDQPAKANISTFINELKKNNVKYVFRVCQSTYDSKILEKEGIIVYDLPFDDGGYPSRDIINDWLTNIKNIFTELPGTIVAVHCVAGLGRAPVMVAIALIEANMKYEDAVSYIRQRRRGAINSRQLEFLENYKPSQLLKFKRGNRNCTIQ